MYSQKAFVVKLNLKGYQDTFYTVETFCVYMGVSLIHTNIKRACILPWMVENYAFYTFFTIYMFGGPQNRMGW